MNIEEYNEFTKHNKREKLNLSGFEGNILNEETMDNINTMIEKHEKNLF
jgi:hypothetical protein